MSKQKSPVTIPLSIRLVLDGMRAQIENQFVGFEDDIRDQVKSAIDGIIKEFDFDATIQRILQDRLREIVKREASYVVSQLLESQKIRQAAERAVIQSLRNIIFNPPEGSSNVAQPADEWDGEPE